MTDFITSSIGTFFALSMFIFQPLIDTVPILVDFVSTAFLNVPRIHSSPIDRIDTIKHYLSTYLQKLNVRLGVEGVRVTSLWLQGLGGTWRRTGDMGKVIMLGWVILGIMLVIGVTTFRLFPRPVGLPDDIILVITDVSKTHMLDDTRSDAPKPASEFSSTSTRTNTATSTAGSQSSNGNQSKVTMYRTHRTHPVAPPHLILLRYIYPKESSYWPAYYLQSFHRAQQSLMQQDELTGGHVDAPPSSGTRGNKDGCVGKIILDKKMVQRDLKNGVVGFREGYTSLVSMSMSSARSS